MMLVPFWGAKKLLLKEKNTPLVIRIALYETFLN